MSFAFWLVLVLIICCIQTIDGWAISHHTHRLLTRTPRDRSRTLSRQSALFVHRSKPWPHPSEIIPKPLAHVDQVDIVRCAPSLSAMVARPDQMPMMWEAVVESFVPLIENKPLTLRRYLSTQQARYERMFGLMNVTVPDVQSQDNVHTQSEFCATVGTVNFLNTKFQPRVFFNCKYDNDTRQAVFHFNRSEITTKFHGERFNESFFIQGENVFSLKYSHDKGRLLHSRARLQVDVLLPRTSLPDNMLKHSGTHIVFAALNAYVAPIVQSMAKDYLLWSSDEKNIVEFVSNESDMREEDTKEDNDMLVKGFM